MAPSVTPAAVDLGMVGQDAVQMLHDGVQFRDARFQLRGRIRDGFIARIDAPEPRQECDQFIGIAGEVMDYMKRLREKVQCNPLLGVHLAKPLDHFPAREGLVAKAGVQAVEKRDRADTGPAPSDRQVLKMYRKARDPRADRLPPLRRHERADRPRFSTIQEGEIVL
jgi:hypothetical protein